VRAARAPFLDTDDLSSPDGTPPDAPMQWPGSELLHCELFTDVRQSVIERRLTLTADDYVGHLTTVSAYLQLPASDQRNVFRAIRRVVPEQVEVVADVIVHLARRRSVA
jgi:hypothetical protein